ncbi:MAG: RNA-binding protein [marine bacterium B5-7]|nr:MAG: RNA-binding protein [marine bacterium B5-7]
MNIYVGNLSYSVTEDELQNLFAEFGVVTSANLIMDRETGRSKGFGFVEMENKEEAETAIKAIDGKEVGGRSLKVNEARPRPERSSKPPRRGSW